MSGVSDENIAHAMPSSLTPPEGLTRREMREWERKHKKNANKSEDLIALELEHQLSKITSTPAQGMKLPRKHSAQIEEEQNAAPQFKSRRELRDSTVIGTRSNLSLDSFEKLNVTAKEGTHEAVSAKSEIAPAIPSVELNAAGDLLLPAVPEKTHSSTPTDQVARPHRLLSKLNPIKYPLKSSLAKNFWLTHSDRKRQRKLTQQLISVGALLVSFAFALSISVPANALLTASDIDQIKMQAFLEEQVSLANQSVIVSEESAVTNLATRDGVDITLAKKPVAASYYGSSGLCGTETEVNPPSSSGSIIWPLTNNKISSPYGYRWGSLHAGIDFEGPTGTPIMSVADGVVKAAFPSSGNSLGICTIISHNVNGVKFDTLYGHLSELGVGVGQPVSVGQVIGTVGSTGNSTGSHLHFEVHVNGIQVDPAPFMSNYAGSAG